MNNKFKLFIEAVQEERFLNFVKKGLELRPDGKGGRTFWEDFTDLVSANPDMASEFLGIPRDMISTLRPKIKSMVERITEENRKAKGKNTLF